MHRWSMLGQFWIEQKKLYASFKLGLLRATNQLFSILPSFSFQQRTRVWLNLTDASFVWRHATAVVPGLDTNGRD